MTVVTDSSWSNPATVAGFEQSPPNAALIELAEHERQRVGPLTVLDIGCGAGRNAVPLARLGCRVFGIDLSRPMLEAAIARVHRDLPAGSLHVARARMDALPVADHAFNFVVAHGIWNLAGSSAEFRRAVRGAARAAQPGAVLFVFTFSRHTLREDAQPVAGEPFLFTEFSGALPQVFLTEAQLVSELGDAGFVREPAIPLRELNRPKPGLLAMPTVPVIYEAVFRRAPR
jgi:SAM-dependent methyltransferase